MRSDQLALAVEPAPVPVEPPRLRVVCDACGWWRAPWTCRRQAEGFACRADEEARTIARLVPRVPVRHWVLTLEEEAPPIATVVKAFVQAVFAAHRAAAVDPSIPGARRCGAVAIVSRLSRSLDPAARVHVLALDGVYVSRPRGALPVFVPLSDPPQVDAVARALRGAAVAIERAHVDASIVQGPAIRPVRSRAPGGTRVYASARPITPEARDTWLRFVRGLLRPGLDPRRITPRPRGGIRYTLPIPLSDGARIVELPAEALAARLAALVPAPSRRVTFHGILATGPHARAHVLPAQLALADRPPQILAPPPPGRLPPHRVPRPVARGEP